MIKKNNIILNKICDNLSIKKNDNIYLGVDVFLLYSLFKEKKIDRFIFVDEILNFFLKRIGKNGSLVIPVFSFDTFKKKKFDQKNSPGQSGALGALLLKKYYKFRTTNPFYSFLCFGKRKNFYLKIKEPNSMGEKSIWKYFIKDKFSLVTLGYHYNRSFSHVHYLERLKKINYRYDKKFIIKYTDIHNKTKKKNFFFYVRKEKICDHSAITKGFDQYLLNNNFVKFYKFKNFISFKLNFKDTSKIILNDLNRKKPRFISILKKNTRNNSILVAKNLLRLEQKYINS